MPPSRKSRAHLPTHTKTLVVDNGGYSIKAGFVTSESSTAPRIIPNCIARDRVKKIYVASDLTKCKDFSEMQFRRPVEKGFIVNWEAQKEIWDHEFFDDKAPLRCDPSETRLLLAEAPNNLPSLQSNCDQMVFEEFRFASYCRSIGPTWNAYGDVQSIFRPTATPTPAADSITTAQAAEVLLLVDAGFSHTTVTPLLRGRPLHSAVRRVDVGGKLMTNYLARLLSLRHYDMRAETYIVNEMKELACFVSLDFGGDLERCWKGARGSYREEYRLGSGGLAKDYVLPDFVSRSKGVVRDFDATMSARARRLAAGQGEDVLTLRNERFTVPELFFSGRDLIGLRQPGLADAVMDSLAGLPLGLWPAMLANIVLVGGSALLPGFVERLQREVMARAPDECVVRVARPKDPVVSTWEGGRELARGAGADDLNRLVVTRQEYEENGAQWVARKFAAGLGVP